jgi:hypothetical protein
MFVEASASPRDGTRLAELKKAWASMSLQFDM